MWLLDTTTFALKLFVDDRNIDYAILSHCWADSEVSFADIQNGRLSRDTAGWRKLQGACEQSRRDDIPYLWMDTCCIDKSSSAELSEAINSMYRWYGSARVCYVFLEDVDHEDDLAESKWFTRGWTLQELIAPVALQFYNSQWRGIGSRNDYATAIHDAIGIPRGLLNKRHSLATYSIAQRMSWAATRQTTRAEDMAYSLMGLFSVNMPMLYGEGGERAFVRLQEEIIKISSDQTIFAWKLEDSGSYSSLIASSPQDFANCKKVIQVMSSKNTAFQLTNLGLQISLRVRPLALGVIQAQLLASDHSKPVWIELGCPNAFAPVDQFGRMIYQSAERRPFKESENTRNFVYKQLTVPRYPFPGITPQESNTKFCIDQFMLIGPEKGGRLSIGDGVYPITGRSSWEPAEGTIEVTSQMVGAAVGFGLMDRMGHLHVFLKLGVGAELAPWAWIVPAEFNGQYSLRKLVLEAWEGRKTKKRVEWPHVFIDKSAEGYGIFDMSDFHGIPRPDHSSRGSYFEGDRAHGLDIMERGLRVKISRSQGYGQNWYVSIYYDVRSVNAVTG